MVSAYDERLTIAEAVDVLRREGCDITSNKLRQYEKDGLLSPEKDKKSKYRLYSSNDLSLARTIVSLLFLGYSIKKIRYFFELWEEVYHLVEMLSDLQKQDEDIKNRIKEGKKNKKLSKEKEHELEDGRLGIIATRHNITESNKNYLSMSKYLEFLDDVRKTVKDKKRMLELLLKGAFNDATKRLHESILKEFEDGLFK